MRRFSSLILPLTGLALIAALFGYVVHKPFRPVPSSASAASPASAPAFPPPGDRGQIQFAANMTWANYIHHRNAGGLPLAPPPGSNDTDVPPIYWDQVIADLKPLRVYESSTNIFIVQSVAGEVEEGLYVVSGFSSDSRHNDPQTGPPGYTLDYAPKRSGEGPCADWVSHYTKAAPQQQGQTSVNPHFS